MSMITGKNLSLGYEGNIIVSQIHFQIQQGDYVCIVGENGAGKSTLMKTLLGLLPPVHGEIIFGDGLQPNEVGYLPQQTQVQKDFPASVKEIVLSGCQGRMGLRPFYTKEEKSLALENMEKMKVSDLSKRCFRELSGGQQQRVLLARALCATRKVLLLDEPAAGLDPKVTGELYQMIRELHAEGITILMITHDIGVAMHDASHMMHVGNDFFYGTRKEYLCSDEGRRFLYFHGKEITA